MEQETSGFDATSIERIIGSYGGDRPGPTVLCVAGVHGNEPAGVEALVRVFELLERRRPPIQGRLVGLAGNLPSLREGRRFLNNDLNRQWSLEYVEALERNGHKASQVSEDSEQLALIKAIRKVLSEAVGEVYFIDLHTFSAQGAPFAIIDDTLTNRRFVAAFPVPTLLGLEERLEGTLHEYINRLGHVAMVFESGRHQDRASVDRAESAVLAALIHTGMLSAADLGLTEPPAALLSRAAKGMPRFLEMRYRHNVAPSDEFRMNAGYRNLQQVRIGEVIAKDRHGDVIATETSRIVLPLYQGQGNDGFFLARPFRPFWIKVSTLLRTIGLNRCVHWLPGVRRHPERKGMILVNPRIAHWMVVEVFHLLGFRMYEPTNGKWVFSRRVNEPPPAGGEPHA